MVKFFRRLWTFVRPYKVRLILGLLFGGIYAGTSGALLLMVKVVVNLTLPGTGHLTFQDQLAKAPSFFQPLVQHLEHWLPSIQSPSSRTGQVMLICTLPLMMLIRAVSGYLNVYLTNWAAARAIADLRVRLFNHLQNQPLSFFSTARTGDLIARVVNDTSVLYSIITNSLASLMKDPLTVLCLLAVVLLPPATRTLTLVSIVVLPICVVPITIYARKVRGSARAMQGHLADMAAVMHESFTGNRIVKAYNLEDISLGRFRKATQKFVSHVMRVVRANELPSQMTEFLGVIGVSLVLVYSMYHMHATTGDFVTFLLSIVLMYQSIKPIVRVYNQVNQALAASAHVFEYLQLPNSVLDPANPLPLRSAGAEIHFEGVDFDYGDKPVLRGIDFTVKPGQLLALVGRSGSGKTTIANLLLRFYDPKKGCIKIGGVDLRNVSIKGLREQIALVAQETILFNDTIRENIRLGRRDATDAEIEAAARHAYAHEFIMEKPFGYETLVGEKGVSLSVGQRQRIAIARALLRNAPILVLDEATSALDSESERAVQAGFEELMQGRTTICIAHRLSTIQKADVILVLENGRIMESGTHSDLLQRRGVYCKLYEIQFEAALA